MHDGAWQVHTLHTENPIKLYLNIVKEINVTSTENKDDPSFCAITKVHFPQD